MFAKAIRIPLLLAMLLLPSLAGAESGDRGSPGGNGIVSGTVKDTAGAVLQGAQITLQPTAITVASDAQGNFVIPNLVPGTYTVTISYVGFNNSVSTVEVKNRPNDATQRHNDHRFEQSADSGQCQSSRGCPRHQRAAHLR